MEKVFPPGFMNVMQHLLLHLPWEAKVGGPVQFRWMYSQERELKKLRAIVRNKARVEGCIAKAYETKEITNFTSKYFSSEHNVNAPTMRYHVVEKAAVVTELQIFQWKGKGVGASTSHYVSYNELNSYMLYLFSNMDEVQPYFTMFNQKHWKSRRQPTSKQLHTLRLNGVKGGQCFVQWFREHVICLHHSFLLVHIHIFMLLIINNLYCSIQCMNDINDSNDLRQLSNC